MAEKSKIQWTDATWNIARGCTKVDEDCKFCYMYRDGDRFGYDAKQIIRTKSVFNLPLKLKEPSKIFTCSLTDFFHVDCDGFRQEAWNIIRKCPQHTFQILTKRPERIMQSLPDFWNEIENRCWIGTSIGSSDSIHRFRRLMELPIMSIKFLSLEPLYDRIYLPFEDMLVLPDWIIVGGESGNDNGKYRYRECKLHWIENIVMSCGAHGVPVFVKQLGTHLAKEMKLHDRHGGDINEWPEHLKIRNFPLDKSKFIS